MNIEARLRDLREFQDPSGGTCYCSDDWQCLYCQEALRERHLAAQEAIGSWESAFQDELQERLNPIVYPAVARTWRRV